MHFESPFCFLLFLLLPVLVWFKRTKAGGGSLRFSSTAGAAQVGRSLRQRLVFVPAALRLLALACLVIALARPQTGREKIRDISKGIAIEMVLDRSGSMGAEMEYHGRLMSRLDVVRDVFKQFALGGDADLGGRPNDLIGMITFARYPDTACPLTLAHGALEPFLESIKLVQRKEEDGTAIGDALALAAARLKTAEKSLQNQGKPGAEEYRIKSKVIILLSDGANNFGRRTPLEAAALAKKWGIKVYTIAIGGSDAVTSIRTPFGVYKVPMAAAVDTQTLRAVAEETGGFFRETEDAGSLQAVYKEIDAMEKSEVETIKYVDYKEAFLPFALAGLLLLALEVMLSCSIFRKIP